MMKLIKLVITILAVSCGLSASAQTKELDLKVFGRNSALVDGAQIALADIAEIQCTDPQRYGELDRLSKIRISQAPKAGLTKTLSAREIIQTLKSNGVDLTKVGYSFPSEITVTRSSAEIGVNRIVGAIEKALNKSVGDIRVAGINPEAVHTKIPIGELQLNAIPSPLAAYEPGRRNFTLTATVDDSEEIRVPVVAEVEEWAEFPVAARPLSRGEIVEEKDIAKARLNINAIPRDIVREPESVVGLATMQQVQSGEVFRENRLRIVPVIDQGQKVTVIYTLGAVHASATGIALDAGVTGDKIRVKNESSKRIIEGEIVEPGLVKVMP